MLAAVLQLQIEDAACCWNKTCGTPKTAETSRCEAGHADARRMIERAPWHAPADKMEGVIVHELSARSGG